VHYIGFSDPGCSMHHSAGSSYWIFHSSSISTSAASTGFVAFLPISMAATYSPSPVVNQAQFPIEHDVSN
jgi:hypothetical protein